MGKEERLKRVNRKQVIAMLLAVVVGAAIWAAAKPAAGTMRVHFETAAGKKSPVFDLRVAASEGERIRGLQFVKQLGEREGMLFVFPSEAIHTFWMKDTYIPLDMIFLDHSRRVVGIVENAAVLTTDTRSVQAPSVYVIELAGGTAARAGIEKGSTAVFSKDVAAIS